MCVCVCVCACVCVWVCMQAGSPYCGIYGESKECDTRMIARSLIFEDAQSTDPVRSRCIPTGEMWREAEEERELTDTTIRSTCLVSGSCSPYLDKPESCFTHHVFALGSATASRDSARDTASQGLDYRFRRLTRLHRDSYFLWLSLRDPAPIFWRPISLGSLRAVAS